MENWIIILIIGVISLLRWIFGEGGLKDTLGRKDDSAPQRPAPNPRRTEPQRQQRPAPTRDPQEEQVRKFLEALGLPPDAEPPPPVRPAQQARTETPPPVPVERPTPPIAAPRPVARPPVSTPPRRTAAESRRQPPPVPRPERKAPPPIPTVSPAPAEQPVPATVSTDEELLLLELKRREAEAYTRNLKREIGQKKGTESASFKKSLRARLRSPEGTREAIVLRELLATPPGLRNLV